MGNSQSSEGPAGVVHRAECRETPSSGCMKSEYAFQSQQPLSDKMVAAGLGPDALQQELQQVNEIWTAKVGQGRVNHQNLGLLLLVVGVAAIIISTQTSDSCSTRSRGSGSSRRGSSTTCSELPGGAVFGVVLLSVSMLILMVSAMIWKKKTDEAMAAIGSHVNTMLEPRWAGMGIRWRVGSFSERSGKNSRRTVFYIEAYLTPEALQRVGMLPPTAMMAPQQPMYGQPGMPPPMPMPMPMGPEGAPWTGNVVPTALQAQGQPMMMPVMPQAGEQQQQQGGAFAYPPAMPMPGGYPYATGGAYPKPIPPASEYDALDKPTATGAVYSMPPGAANYAYTYGGFAPAAGPGGGAGPYGSAPPVSDRKL